MEKRDSLDSSSSCDSSKSLFKDSKVSTSTETISTASDTSTVSTVKTKTKAKLPKRILERHLEILQYEALTEEQQMEYLDYWDEKFKEDLRLNPPPVVPNYINAQKHVRSELALFDLITESLYKRAYFSKHRRPRRI